MFTPTTLTDHQRKQALGAMSDCLRLLADEGLGAEEAAACLMGAAWHSLSHRAAADEVAGYMRGLIDSMAGGVPGQH